METRREDYNKYRANKLESGRIYQDFITDLLATELSLIVQQYSSRAYQLGVGETRQGVEIKHDEQFAKTGNLWIEMAEKAVPRPGDYAKSGINRMDNSWLFVIGDYDTVFVFPLIILRGLSTRFPSRENNTKTSVGFLLPCKTAFKWASVILRPQAAQKVEKHIKDIEAIGRELQREMLRDRRQGDLFGQEDW